MKSILSGVLAGEKFGRAESSARALPIEFIERSRISYGKIWDWADLGRFPPTGSGWRGELQCAP